MVLAQLTNSPEWWRFLSDSKDSFGSIESVLKSLAIIAAGGWALWHFWVRREKYPRVALEHKIESWSISEEDRLVRVVLVITNTSDVLLKVKHGYTWLQELKPRPTELIEKFKEDCAFDDNPKKEFPQEVAWKLLGEKRHKGVEAEPKESGPVTMDFIVNKRYEQLLVYSFIDNPQKRRIKKAFQEYIQRKEPKRFGWSTSNVISFSESGGVITDSGQARAGEKPAPAVAESAQQTNQVGEVKNMSEKTDGQRQGQAKPRPQPAQQPPRRINEQSESKPRPEPVRGPKKDK